MNCLASPLAAAVLLSAACLEVASAQSPYLTPYNGSIGFNGSSYFAPPTDFTPYRPVVPNPFGPYDLLGGYARAGITAAQPTGHVIIPTGPNGYIYQTTFGSPAVPAPPSAVPSAAAASGYFPSPQQRANASTAEASQSPSVLLDAAIAAFQAGRYESAATYAAAVVVADSRVGQAHLLESHALFAMRRYADAAASLRRALQVLPESDWGFVLDRYRDFYRATQYTQHLADLERWIVDHPDDENAQLLLGYHAAGLGQTTLAVEHLRAALTLDPKDAIASRLLAKLTGGETPAPAPAETTGPREF
ncbi:MAG TPA: hypothetical protein VHV77_03110 [Pirellulales bacterium]|nr:hypothetical protein [Pirellulales bacterium]